jgi:hypothetical protein
MLYAIDGGRKLVTSVPHRREFRLWKSRLTAQEIAEIKRALDAKIDSDEVHTSSWIPGADWSGTPYEPIYLRACRRDEQAAAKCFGLLVWEVFLERSEAWSFGRFEKDGFPIAGLTYFRI